MIRKKMTSSSSPKPTKITGVLTLSCRERVLVLLEFPKIGKKLPLLKATTCSLQSAGTSGGKRVDGRVTEANATVFWEKMSSLQRKQVQMEIDCT